MTEPIKFLDENALAAMLGVSPRTLQRWRQTGEGPAYVRLGGRRVAYSESSVAAWANERTFPHIAAELSADESTR